MKNKDYIVKRKDIYLGEVVKANGIYKRFLSGNEPSGSLDVKTSVFYRNMLFTPTEYKFASDLLYDTDNYPILNGTIQEYVLNLEEGSLLIKDYYNLEELLDFFCYSEELNINDIVKLYNTFFTGVFPKKYSSLFGRELIPINEMDQQLKKYQNDYITLQKSGNNIYRIKEESILSRYYWDLLQNDKSSFKPKKEEGKIKKLVRF